MKRIILILSVLALLVCPGCGDSGRGNAGGQSHFRVRSEFGAPLNADQGWAGALNENVTIQADQPFRVRFEVESSPESIGERQFRLQYRRNQGDWNDVEAHDFPHPLREVDIDFASAAIGSTAEGWRAASGDPSGMAVALQDSVKVLQTRADQEPLIVLYGSQWPPTEMAAEFRLPAGTETGVGFVFGYVDASNHYRVLADAAAGAIRVIRVAEGVETVITERAAEIAAGEWLEIEVQTEGEKVEVNYQDGLVEFTAEPGGDLPSTQFGFLVPAGGNVAFRAFSISGEAKTPRVSIVSCTAFQNGAVTTDLLAGSAAGFKAGAGVSLVDQTAAWNADGAHGEFEWPLVLRRFADGPVTNDEGDSFELRMVEAGGGVLDAYRNPVLRLTIPPRHVGGTFVEAPGRIGPFQAKNGDLYFIMEPTETDNRFMMIKSTDGGVTWREVDGANRPATDDLESVDARQVGDTIHIIHQVTRSVLHHSFRTSDHPTRPDSWDIRDERAGAVNSVAQAATLVVRSDGSMVAFYVGDTVHYSIRSAAGTWSKETAIDAGKPNSAGPRAVLGADDTVHLAYYGMDGTIWYRRLLRNGTLTPRQRLASGLGKTRAEFGSVLPLIYIPETKTVVVIYRAGDGNLWERRVVNVGSPTAPVKVTDRKVIQDAVDSQQPAADAVLDGNTIHVFFIEESSRSIFSTHDKGGWQPSTLRVDKILGSWIRGNVYARNDGARVYGYVYDAGSDGGAGMNRFDEAVLGGQ